jgi:hypothetical protein
MSRVDFEKTVPVTIRLTNKEVAAIEADAMAAGLSRAAYIRRRIFQRASSTDHRTAALAALLQTLHRATNFGQTELAEAIDIHISRLLAAD